MSLPRVFQAHAATTDETVTLIIFSCCQSAHSHRTRSSTYDGTWRVTTLISTLWRTRQKGMFGSVSRVDEQEKGQTLVRVSSETLLTHRRRDNFRENTFRGAPRTGKKKPSPRREIVLGRDGNSELFATAIKSSTFPFMVSIINCAEKRHTTDKRVIDILKDPLIIIELSDNLMESCLACFIVSGRGGKERKVRHLKIKV